MQNKPAYLFIDADDTLWENELYFRKAEAAFAAMIAPHVDLEEIRQTLWHKQEVNIASFGYGSKTYFLIMVDTAIDLCGGIDREKYDLIRRIVLRLCYHEIELLDGVEETLKILARSYRLILTTKGDNLEQFSKLRRSGISEYFHAAEVLVSKNEDVYRSLARKYEINPEDVVMVGNSVRSDIVPVINIGGKAVHIPHGVEWIHEKADFPDSMRAIRAKKFTELPKILINLR